MRGNIIIGMLAGTMIGAIAAMIAMPYISPQIDKLMNRGKQMLTNKMNQMDAQVQGN